MPAKRAAPTAPLLALMTTLTATALPLADAASPAAAPLAATQPAAAQPAAADALAATSAPPRGQSPQPRVLVWHDAFAQPLGSPPDPRKWTHDLGDHGWGNAELQAYTDSPANASIVADPDATGGRALAIRALRDEASGQITSARLKTQGKFATRFGRIEARLKLPSGQGIWPAFWTLGETIAEAGWPACGEIDIMEYLGHEAGKVYATIHGPGHSGGDNRTTAHWQAPRAPATRSVPTARATFRDPRVAQTRPRGAADALPASSVWGADYHVFAVEWLPGRISWFVDDECFHTLTPADLPKGAHWVFDDTAQFLLFNLAVGGHWPGYPDATTTFPQEYRIDYVRVWAFDATPAE